MLRGAPHYRADAFVQGLKAAGFRIADTHKQHPRPCDVLVIWNRYGFYDAIARTYEEHGATVLVAENGWIGLDEQGAKVYAICRSQHNGAGSWHVGNEDRWSGFGVRLQDWRRDGDAILVLPQRGIGPPGVAMPDGWLEAVVERLTRVTKRPIIVRPHPGNVVKGPIDFSGIYAAVTWASGAGIKALAAGIPVFHDMSNWIGAPAARSGVDQIEDPFLGDRLPAFRRLAWAQWKLAEIERGEPFRWLCASR